MMLRVGLLLLSLSVAVFGQNDVKLPPETKVLDVVKTSYQGCGVATGNYARLGDTITLSVTNLATLQSNAVTKDCSITLFLGGMELTNICPQPVTGIDTKRSANLLTFLLKRSDSNSSVWRSLLRRPFQNGISNPKIDEYRVSIGLQKGEPAASDAIVRLVVYEPRPWVIAWAGTSAVVLVLFLIMAAKTELLRDRGPAPADGRRAYSLARVQMACWFVIVAISYIAIWMITGELDTINAQVLMLMGISSVTYLSAEAIDQTTNTQPNFKSRCWLRDILSDNDGISFHRFQIVVWTLILGAMFLISVFNELTMPEFSSTMLGLMGLSAGTYLGFKFPGVRGGNDITDKPKNPKANVKGQGKVEFKADAVPRAGIYELWIRSEGETEYTKNASVVALSTGLQTDIDLTPGKKVFFKWRGTNDAGTGPFSDEQSVIPT